MSTDEEYKFDEINDTSITEDNEVELSQKHKDSEETEAQRMIKVFQNEWPQQDKTPSKRGKVYCFAYFRNEPLITIGPDFTFSIAEIVMINMLLYIPMSKIDHDTMNYKFSVTMLLAQNVMFLMTVMSNQGMISRDPTKHDESYLREISTKNHKQLLCTICRLIVPEGSKNVHHCPYCNVCVQGHDHHCVWCSKCIAQGNMKFFTGFLLCTVMCLLGFWANMISLIIYESQNLK